MLTYTATNNITYSLEPACFGELSAYQVTADGRPGFAWMYWHEGRWRMGWGSTEFAAVEDQLRRVIELERAVLN